MSVPAETPASGARRGRNHEHQDLKMKRLMRLDGLL
jgi:hypothetical protein